MMNAKDKMLEMVNSGKYHEITPNRSPALDALCEEFGAPLGSSWCALFASKAFHDCYVSGQKFHYTAGSQDLLAWFKHMGWTSTNPQDLLLWKGALIIRTDPGGEHGHVALPFERLTNSQGKILALETLEGNTNVYGGSNGDGAYMRRRNIPLSPFTWTFCNTSNICGGQWW